MSSFTQTVKNRKPLRTFVLPATAWSQDWKKRPGEDLAVGLRLIAEADIQTSNAEAIRYAISLYREESGKIADMTAFVGAFNDGLVHWLVGRSCCDPNDTDLSFFGKEEDTVRRGLTSDGARFCFDEYERFRRETSPTQPPATDADLDELGALLRTAGILDRLTTARKLGTRKLLGGILDELRAADPDRQPEGDGVILLEDEDEP